MRAFTRRFVPLLTAGALLLAARPGFAQYREYYLRGRVLDAQKKPIADVTLRLRDVATSRSYNTKTDKEGLFKFAGLPHGIYEVRFEKAGYAPATSEWKFETPQDTMQRVDISDTVLTSLAQAAEAQQVKETDAASREAADKLSAGDLDGAIALLEGVLRDEPKDAGALYLMGLSYVGKKRYREAADAFIQVTEQTARFPGAWFELGVCYKELGDRQKALEAYDKHLELQPGNADSLYNSGLILFETNRIDEALARFERGLLAKPDDPELLELVGRCHINASNFDAALRYLEKARAASSDPRKIAFLDELIGTLKARAR